MYGRRFLVSAALISVALFAWIIWPTPWAYRIEEHQSKAMTTVRVRIRINRFTGDKQSFVQGRWIDGSVVF